MRACVRVCVGREAGMEREAGSERGREGGGRERGHASLFQCLLRSNHKISNVD